MGRTLTDRLALVAQARAEAEAVVFGGGSLTFAGLEDRAARLAGTLKALGVRRGDRVGISLQRGLDMPVAVYSVMLAGAGYVPIDPAAPPPRMQHILRDCGIGVLITQEARIAQVADAAPGTGLHSVIGVAAPLDGLTTLPFDAALQGVPHREPLGPDDLAYIIFTSGSTGVPKGLTHTHASALAFVDMATALYDLGPNDRMAATSALHFDMSCMEMFAGLLSGACIVMVPEAHAMMPASLAHLLDEQRITTLYTVPFQLIRLVEAGALEARDLSALRLVIHAGEPMPPRPIAQLRAVLPHARFSNFYGPAEVNGVTHWDHPPEGTDPSAPVPIGHACAHADLLIDGETPDSGELLVATPAMMRGYWRRPDLDAACFVTRTGTDGTMRRYYRTGDLVSRRPDGALLLLGRADRQVKLRGYRVELDEVELALDAHPAVSEAAALLSPDKLRILAFVRLAPGQAAQEADLHEIAARRLPAHAVPASIRILPQFPRTATGKIDRRRLLTEDTAQ
ncbi:amino acid adenylation domain-containing protein [Fluviibacterium sp. DFM31]|uniref:Amino acid adenylation domain-containing protein n=1 Tax=Meridianimarinicoccus marinus TaxID=3231483 RepID=A0ABV3L614_9RHOB